VTVIEGLRTHLLALPAIATLVGGTRIYPLRLPQKAVLAAIVVTRVDDPRIGTHLRGPGGLSRARIQVDAWAQTHDQATALGTLCRRRLDGFQGTWTGTGSPAPTIAVAAIHHDDEGDRFEEEILGGLCRHGADYFVTYRASDEAMTAFD
jgi:hypothetical protein